MSLSLLASLDPGPFSLVQPVIASQLGDDELSLDSSAGPRCPAPFVSSCRAPLQRRSWLFLGTKVRRGHVILSWGMFWQKVQHTGKTCQALRNKRWWNHLCMWREGTLKRDFSHVKTVCTAEGLSLLLLAFPVKPAVGLELRGQRRGDGVWSTATFDTSFLVQS